MAFKISSSVEEGVAKIVLEGDLDSLSARIFQKEIEVVATDSPKELVLYMEKLTIN